MSFRGIWHIAYKQAYHLDGMNRRLGSRDCTGAMFDPWPEKPLRIDAKVIARRGKKTTRKKVTWTSRCWSPKNLLGITPPRSF